MELLPLIMFLKESIVLSLRCREDLAVDDEVKERIVYAHRVEKELPLLQARVMTYLPGALVASSHRQVK